ncbi:MAG: hypothetical protein V3V13_02940 [Paracoccaceae bacterium]
MKRPFYLLLIPMFGIAACTPDVDSLTNSSFNAPDASGNYSTSLTSTESGKDVDVTGRGYAYIVGIRDGNSFQGYAGLIPGATVIAPPAAGTAAMAGTYQVARITGISLNGNLLTGTPVPAVSAPITLTADFGAGTLAGSSPFLTVNGTFSGETLGGSVVYRGLNGSLTGLVGSDRAIGAFHGNNATDIYAGGFYVVD